MKSDNYEEINLLIKYGAEVNVMDSNCMTLSYYIHSTRK